MHICDRLRNEKIKFFLISCYPQARDLPSNEEDMSIDHSEYFSDSYYPSYEDETKYSDNGSQNDQDIYSPKQELNTGVHLYRNIAETPVPGNIPVNNDMNNLIMTCIKIENDSDEDNETNNQDGSLPDSNTSGLSKQKGDEPRADRDGQTGKRNQSISSYPAPSSRNHSRENGDKSDIEEDPTPGPSQRNDLNFPEMSDGSDEDIGTSPHASNSMGPKKGLNSKNKRKRSGENVIELDDYTFQEIIGIISTISGGMSEALSHETDDEGLWGKLAARKLRKIEDEETKYQLMHQMDYLINQAVQGKWKVPTSGTADSPPQDGPVSSVSNSDEKVPSHSTRDSHNERK